MTFELAATPEMLGLALAAKTRVREPAIYLQLFANARMAAFKPTAAMTCWRV
ncbi:hypothetical protein [Paracoccus mutanolyticus]|uniref:hypothetical protein n=1 Tax=Paracoccus mutanolyticus TaxID=1499308 RepID=UPI0016794946|nr:hypothetical protein [Paracoccus mutanolyticus]